jgi:Arginase family
MHAFPLEVEVPRVRTLRPILTRTRAAFPQAAVSGSTRDPIRQGDVLDDAIMPAVDYRLSDGLSWEELTTAMCVAIESGRVVGLEVTIYNPKLDPDGAGAGSLARIIGDALA